VFLKDQSVGLDLLREEVKQEGEAASRVRPALAAALAATGDWPAATDVLRQCELAQAGSEYLLVFGRSALRDRKFSEAVPPLNELRHRDAAARREALPLLYRAYNGLKRPQEAIGCVHELARLDPDQPVHWRQLVKELDATGQHAESVAAHREALSHGLPAPLEIEFRRNLTATLMLLCDVESARSELAPLLNDTQAPAVTLLEAKLLRLEGQPVKALELLDEALARGAPADSDWYALRAMLLLDLERFGDAVAVLEKLVSDDPFDQYAHYRLADAYRGLGRLDEARRHQQISTSIGEKRVNLHKLAQQAERESPTPEQCDRLAELSREINDSAQALHWEERARALRAAQARSR
jgi:tetratricopeptide (TPR) repeat protein